MHMHLRLDRYASPLAPLLLVTGDDGILRALEFADHESRMHRLLHDHYGEVALQNAAAPKSVIEALDAYFDGELNALDKLPTATGGTKFQRAVWCALRSIPAGTTESYGALATRLGRTGSGRAVGAANGANPIAIVVPCHRVIGADGTLTGYGGGLARKSWLLDHERQYSDTQMVEGNDGEDIVDQRRVRPAGFRLDRFRGQNPSRRSELVRGR